MLKVAIIIERAQIGLGGAERSVSELTAELRTQDVAATILAAKGTPSENTQVLCADYKKKRVPLKVFEKAIQQHLEKSSYDIIHSTLPLAVADIYQPRGGSYREAMLQNIASYPCVCRRTLKRWTHLLNLKRTQYLNAEKKLCAAVNKTHIAALSNYVKEHFKKHYHLPDERITVVPNGIKPDLEPDENTAGILKETILKSVSIPNDHEPVVFLFAANNPRLKGFDSLKKAMKQLHDQPPKAVYPILVAVGSKKIEKTSSNIVSLGAVDGIRNVLSICDVAVLPTWYDPCSRFILEALAMAKPVITTRFNGASERYEHQKHGFIIDRPDNIIELTAALKTFCDKDRIELASKAIVDDNLKNQVSIAGHVKRLIGLYETILRQKEK